MTVSDFIKLRLKELNLTQSELAQNLGITKQNLNNKINRDNFSSKEICNIITFLKCDFVFKTSEKEYNIQYIPDINTTNNNPQSAK